MKKNIPLLLLCLAGLLAGAQTFTPVDIYPGADSSNPTNFTVANGKVLPAYYLTGILPN